MLSLLRLHRRRRCLLLALALAPQLLSCPAPAKRHLLRPVARLEDAPRERLLLVELGVLRPADAHRTCGELAVQTSVSAQSRHGVVWQACVRTGQLWKWGPRC
eukprot:5538323-Prymnesium_polylepis.1